MSKKLSITLAAAVFLVGIMAAYFVVKKETANPLAGQKENEKENLIATTTPAIASAQVRKYAGQSLSYLGDSAVLARYPKDFVVKKQAELAGMVAQVKKNPSAQSINYWIQIGILKKLFDNYLGARDAWEYAKSFIDPENSIVRYDLGALYGFYLNDYKKADENFWGAIKLNADPGYFLGLADFYKDFYKEKADRVDDVLLTGLKIMPRDPNLNLKLAYYYKSLGDKNNAVKYFQRFLSLPGITGAQQQAINDEISKLSPSL